MPGTEPPAKAPQYRRVLSGAGPEADPFRPLEAECRVVQFSQPLTPSELAKVGDLLAGRPDVQLYVYGRASHDLDFLGHFPGLKRLQVALYELEDIGGPADVAGTLEEFTVGPTKKRYSVLFP